MIDWAWIGGHGSLIASLLAQHVELTAMAMVLGAAMSFPLGLVALRWPRTYSPILGVTGVLFTIPSLALFILLIPLSGLSTATALAGLTIYTLVILVRNFVEGVRAIPAQVREAADAMGYTAWRRLVRVELPLALPVIMAGVRIATVTTISLVAVTALIGQGGLGQLFLTGFTLQFTTPLVVGVVLSILLAVAADLALVGVQRLSTPWLRGA